MNGRYLETVSGVARAFPGGRAAHPEDQNEEENEENLRKNERNYVQENEERLRKYSYLACLGVGGLLRPCGECFISNEIEKYLVLSQISNQCLFPAF